MKAMSSNTQQKKDERNATNNSEIVFSMNFKITHKSFYFDNKNHQNTTRLTILSNYHSNQTNFSLCVFVQSLSKIRLKRNLYFSILCSRGFVIVWS